MKRSIYIPIRDKIKELSWVNLTGLQLGQFDKPNDGFPPPMPSVLIGFNPFKYENLTNSSQQGEGIVSVYAYFDKSSNDLSTASEEDNMSNLDKLEELFNKLHGYGTDDFSNLERTWQGLYKTGDRYVCWKIDFSIVVFDKI